MAQGMLGLLSKQARIVRVRVMPRDSITGMVRVQLWARMGPRMKATTGSAGDTDAALEDAADKICASWGLTDTPGS